MADLTLQQMLQTPMITRLVSRIKTPMSLFQQFYGLLPGSPATQTIQGRYFGYDLINPTRTLARGRAPGSGPGRTTPKAIGQVTGQIMRMHESVHIQHEQVFRFRPLGSNYGTVDLTGQKYVTTQVNNLSQKFKNSREFMLSRMFRGGFGVKKTGDDWDLVEQDDATATFQVDFQIPDSHLTSLELGTGSDILDQSWSDPTCPVNRHIARIRQAFERLHGRSLRHIWMHPEDVELLKENVHLQQISGSSFSVFQSLTARAMSSDAFEGMAGIPDTGYDIVFRALPLYVFHAYGGGLATDGVETADSSSFTTFIPRGYAIFTPEASPDWLGGINGSEFVRENIMDPGSVKEGFVTWTTNVIDPAGVDLKALDNWIPALYNPKCVAFGRIMPDQVED